MLHLTVQMHGHSRNYSSLMRKTFHVRLPVAHQMDFLRQDSYGGIHFMIGNITKRPDINGGFPECNTVLNYMMW